MTNQDLETALAGAIIAEHQARQCGSTEMQRIAMDQIRQLRQALLLQARNDDLANAVKQVTTGAGD
jgi:hypothetical protein